VYKKIFSPQWLSGKACNPSDQRQGHQRGKTRLASSCLAEIFAVTPNTEQLTTAELFQSAPVLQLALSHQWHLLVLSNSRIVFMQTTHFAFQGDCCWEITYNQKRSLRNSNLTNKNNS